MRAVDRWPIGQTFEMHREAQAITLDIIVRAVFGMEGVREHERLANAISSMLSAMDFGLVGGVWSLTTKTLPPHGRRAKRVVDELLYEEIRRRRADRELEKRGDVLTMLLLARDEDGRPMTDVELRDELMTLLAAGHETTASALAWTFREVLAEQRVTDKLRAELESKLGDEPLTASRLQELVYLDAVVKESLRLRPVIFDVGRRAKQPFEVGGYEIPVGCFVAPCIYLTHRRRDLYPEPSVFRPERFVDKKVDPYEWFPFGGGVRRCLGAAFALWEMKLVLATVLQNADLELASQKPPRAAWHSITLAPSDGTRVIMKQRKKRSPRIERRVA
jgi:cytochrome P450 family 110